MQCLQFDDETIHALKALGFKVKRNKGSASVETTVSVIHPAGGNHLSVIIPLPGGEELSFEISHWSLQVSAIKWTPGWQNEEAMETS
jgi:predicted RNA binding protein YcfA (HicA-like mRNA interferase family)